MKGTVNMARIEKVATTAITGKLKHNTRERTPNNIDVDPDRTPDNYWLSPEDHGRTAKECKAYYNGRMSEVYHYNRGDVKTVCQWVVTAPADLPPKDRDAFFQETYNYLNSLYDEKNCLQAIVHIDEGIKDRDGNIVAGRAHLHYMFIPAVKNKKYMCPNDKGNITASARYPEKVCADELINKVHLQKFHPGLQKWLDAQGIHCTILNGSTGDRNKTVDELKRDTREQLMRDRITELERENAELRTNKNHPQGRWDRAISEREDHGRW